MNITEIPAFFTTFDLLDILANNKDLTKQIVEVTLQNLYLMKQAAPMVRSYTSTQKEMLDHCIEKTTELLSLFDAIPDHEELHKTFRRTLLGNLPEGD